MTKTYPVQALIAPNALSVQWALATVRLITRDVPGDAGAFPLDGLTDEDWTSWLALTSVANYYRPHRAALRALESNPRWLQSESQEGYSSTRRALDQVLGGIEKMSADFEALLPIEIRTSVLTRITPRKGSRSRRFVAEF